MGATGRARAGATGQPTRQALIAAAIASLAEDGFAGSTARSIARRAGSTQSQVFYHFGTVIDLLVAALEEVSAQRLRSYRPLIEGSATPSDLVAAARVIVSDDLGSGSLRVLVEMVATAQSDADLRARISDILRPWFALAESAAVKAAPGLPAQGLVHADDAGFALVATVLGLELLTSLTGDTSRATSLLAHLDRLASLLGAFSWSPSEDGDA